MAEEKALRLRAEASVQDKDREISMMSVDLRQLQYKFEKTDSELRQENEKNRGLVGVSERLKEEKSLMQSELSVQASENTLMKTNEKRLLRDLAEYRERNKSLEEELHKVKAARSVDDLQRFVFLRIFVDYICVWNLRFDFWDPNLVFLTLSENCFGFLEIFSFKIVLLGVRLNFNLFFH